MSEKLEERLTPTQKAQMEAIDEFPMPPKALLMNCLTCGIKDQRVGSTTEGKLFIRDHAGHQTKYRGVMLT